MKATSRVRELVRSYAAELMRDESGIVAFEYLLLVTIVGLGLVVGLGNLGSALNAEYRELGNAILALNQGYSVMSQSGCKASKAGSNTADSRGFDQFPPESCLCFCVNGVKQCNFGCPENGLPCTDNASINAVVPCASP